MRIASIVLRILIGLVFTSQSFLKLTGSADAWRDDLQIAPWFWILTGVVQLIGALGLFVSLRYERLSIPAGLLFVVVMLGALAAHIRVSDPVSDMVLPLVLLLLSSTIVAISWQRTTEHRPGYVSSQRITSS